MKVRYFEGLLKHLLEQSGRDDIAKVETFAEAEVSSKPVGLKVTFTDRSVVYVQFVRTSRPDGDDKDRSPDYFIPDDML